MTKRGNSDQPMQYHHWLQMCGFSMGIAIEAMNDTFIELVEDEIVTNGVDYGDTYEHYLRMAIDYVHKNDLWTMPLVADKWVRRFRNSRRTPTVSEIELAMDFVGVTAQYVLDNN